jgi:hypothetical protein
MLDIEARLVRQAIGFAVTKAMEDINGNARRSIRNLIDLGSLFSKTENQKWFFDAARNVLKNPKNPYNALAARVVRDIDGEAIRRVGLNLGYNALMFGARKIRKKQEALGARIPWLLDMAELPCADFPSRLERCLREGQEVGVFSYALRLNGAENLPALAGLANRYEDCFIALKLPAGRLDEAAADWIAQTRNAAVAVELTGEAREAEDALTRLRARRCLYGFFLAYADRDVNKITSPQFAKWAIAQGCLFGVYEAAGASARAQAEVAGFIDRVRGESGQSLVALDFPRDARQIGDRLRIGGMLNVDLSGAAFKRNPESEGHVEALMALFRRAQVCPT